MQTAHRAMRLVFLPEYMVVCLHVVLMPYHCTTGYMVLEDARPASGAARGWSVLRGEPRPGLDLAGLCGGSWRIPVANGV